MPSPSKSADAKDGVFITPDWRNYIGFKEQLATMGALVARGTAPQVLLFTGREGIGKRAFVMAVAALYYCNDFTACGVCEGCQWVLGGHHPDLFVLDGVSSLKVDHATSLQEHLTIKAGSRHADPARRGRRIAVIIDADQLTPQACNRLLKTIEEPPSGTSVLLTTSRVGALMPTLLSRCVRWALRPPPWQETLALVKALLGQAPGAPPQGDLSDKQLQSLIERAGLSPGKVLGLVSPSGSSPPKDADALSGLLNAGSIGVMLKEAETLVRQRSWTAQDIARQAEYALNASYKDLFTRGGPLPAFAMLKRRREFLRKLRLVACKQKITVNAQLAAEQLGLVSYQRS